MDPRRRVGVLLGMVAAVLTVAACGSSSQTIRGTLMPGGLHQSYADCVGAAPRPGDQVVVVDPSGKVIGSSVLGQWLHDHATVSGVTDYGCHMPFILTGVPSEPRYGFQVQGVPGTLWLTSVADVSLTVGSS